MLFDTDVLIAHLRGNKKATTALNKKTSRISAITYMEIVQGIQNKNEAQQWRSFLNHFDIKTLSIDERISSKAMYLMDEFSLSHGLEINDALIAATAEVYGLSLITGNIKDYRFIPNLVLYPFKE